MKTNIRGLNLNLLLALDALYEERSVTRAAEKLSLSQPTVSGILTRLRDLFGDELYVRTSHGVRPTPRAEALAGPVKEVIRSTRALFDDVEFDPATSEFEIKLSATDYVNRTLITPLVGELVRTAPKARVSITQPSSGMSDHQRILDETDMLFTAHDPQSPGPGGRRVFRDTMVCVSSYSRHRHGQFIELDDLCRLSHIVGQRQVQSAVSTRLVTELGRRGLTRNITVEAPNFESVFRLMNVCELVAFLPAKLARQHGSSLKQLKVDLDIPAASVFARWHPRLDRDPRHVWLRACVDKAAMTLGEGAELSG